MQQLQFIDLQDQLNMFRANFCPSLQDAKPYAVKNLSRAPEDGQKFSRNVLS